MKQLLVLLIPCVTAAAPACGGNPASPSQPAAPASAGPADAGLHATAVAAPRPAQTSRMRGPYPTIDAVCADLSDEYQEDTETRNRCRFDDAGDWDVPVDGPLVLAHPPLPYRSVRLIAIEALDVSCHLLFETSGYYLSPPLPCGSERARADLAIRVDALSANPLSHGAPAELLVRLHTTASFDESTWCEDTCDDAGIRVTESEMTMVCADTRTGPWCSIY